VIRVLCVDDHRLVREGLGLILAREQDMEVVGAAATAEEAVDTFSRTRPDITLMDLQLGRMSGVDAIRAIRALDPGARIIVVTMYHGDEDIYRAMQAGAVTYVVKNTLADDLVRVVRDVSSGLRPLSDDVRETLRLRALNPTLTSREVEVLELVAQGLRNKDVGAALSISEETVRVHLRNLFHKLDVTDRTEAVNVGLRRGIIHLSHG
jgi:two-component system NarL family response regulator